MNNNVLIILSILVLVVGQISEETASQRTQINLSFGQANNFIKDAGIFFFYGFSADEISNDYKFNFLIKLIKDGTASETVESTCNSQSGKKFDDSGIYTNQFICNLPGNKDYDSIEIDSSASIAGLPSDPNLLNPQLTQTLIDNKSLNKIDTDSQPPQFVEQQVIDYTNVGNGLLEFTINLRHADQNIEVGQSFYIKLLYPSGIILKFIITEINELTIKLNCEIEGEVIDQRLYVEQTTIVADGKYLFVLQGFQTEKITVKENVFENEKDEEEAEKEQIIELENELFQETKKEQAKEAEKEQEEEIEKIQAKETEKEQKEEPEKEQKEEAEKEQKEEPEGEQTEEPEGEQTEEEDKELEEEPEGEQKEEPEKEKQEEP